MRIITCKFSHPKDFKHFALALQCSKSIMVFELSNVAMNNDTMRYLIDALQNNAVMQYVCLENIQNVPSDAFLDILHDNKTLLILQIIGSGFTLMQNDIDVIMDSNFTVLQISWMPIMRNQRFANRKGLLKLLVLLCAVRQKQPALFIPSDIMFQVALSLADILD
jgi:hypothetical protein